MTNINRYESNGASGVATGAEINVLIDNILRQGTATFDPSKELLSKLENQVERRARRNANNEIVAMLKQVEARKAAAAPASKRPAPAYWLRDAVAAQQSKFEQEKYWTPRIAEPVEDVTPALTDEQPLKTPLAMPTPDFDAIEAEAARDEHAAHAPVAAAAGGNDWFGHSPDGLPLWMTAGIPVAAVSVFALGMILVNPQGTPDLALTQEPVAIDTVSAVHTGAAVDASDLDLIRRAELVDVNVDTGIVSDLAGEGTPKPPVAETLALTDEVEIAPIEANYIVRKKIEPLIEEVAPAPSLKPTPPPAPSTVNQTPAPEQTSRSLPTRMYTGRMEEGSAAQRVNAIAYEAGSDLTHAEQMWLAADMERALDDEIDGRSVSLKAKDGQRIRVTMVQSRQVQREFEFARVSEISALPHDMVLAGGWYVARQDVMLHATPALHSGLTHRVVKKDQLIERMASYTDENGAQWYLMGQQGLAVGFISPADLKVAGAHKGTLGTVYSEINGATVYEARHVYTKCRRGFIGPLGKQMQPMQFCRGASGNWLDHNDGENMSQIASFASLLKSEENTASMILVAEAVGDPIAYRAFADRKFRQRIRLDLANAKSGQTKKHALPNGDAIEMTFGEKYTVDSKTPLEKVDSLMSVPGSLKVDAEWVKVPIGATLRAAPDYLAEKSLTVIPAGRAVEKLGYVTGTRGDDWVLVGRSGVGFGYVHPEQLTPLQGRVAPKAIKNIRGKTSAELISVSATCRSVTYETALRIGKFDACQQADGSWALETRRANDRRFAQTDSASNAAL